MKIKRFKKPVLLDKHIKESLAKLQKSFAIVPTDKAASNISFVCRKYYHQCMMEELSSPVYQPVLDNENDIISEQKTELKSFDEEVSAENSALPFIYSTIKEHKTPVGNRFIVSGRKCSTKTLSKSLLKVFQLVSKTLKIECNYRCKFSKTKSFWVINNAESIRKDINNINNKRKASSIFSYDFSRLYTNIPHEMLKENVIFALEEAFKIKGNDFYIKINKSSATWAKSKPKKTKLKYVQKDEIMGMLEFLLNNIHIKYRDQIFRQIIGVPMGTDCAPDLANLFLFVFEYKYVMSLIDDGCYDAKLFRFVYRYIEDLLILNDNGHFENIYWSIYPDVLELNSTGTSSFHSSFLDLDLSVEERQFKYTLYDKRNNFTLMSYPCPI